MHFLQIISQAGWLTYCFTELTAATLSYVRPATPNPRLTAQIETGRANQAPVIPGGSPFFYLKDPKGSVFSLASIAMTPNPCRIGFPCSIEAKGTFLSDLSIINMGFELEAHLASGGTSKLMAVEENFCEWMELKQGGVVQCPPRKGDASITYDLVLGRGWVMPATYYLKVNLTTAEDQLLTYLGAVIELKDPLVQQAANAETA